MKTSKIAAGALLAALVVVTSGCQKSSKAAANETGASSGSVTTASPSVTPASSDKGPVTVGFHNLEGGSISLPDVRLGFEAGIKYVNADLGGINGHPMKFITCKTDGTPESSVNCANQFVSQKVALAVQGADFGADAMLPVLKSSGLVDIGAFPLTPGMNSATGDAYMMNFSSQEGYAATVVQQHNLGATKLAVAMVDNAASRASYNDIIAPAGKKIGVETKGFFFPAQTDWTVLSATILSWGADAITLYAAADALPAVQALRSAGFSRYIDVGANTNIIPQLNASQLDKVIFSSPTFQPSYASFPAPVQSDMDVFNRYTKSVQKAGNQGQLEQGFYIAVLAADVLRQIGAKADPLTAQAVHDAMPSVKGDRQIFRMSGYDCSKPTWPHTTACASGEVYVTADKNGKLVSMPNQPVDVSPVLPN